MRLVPRRAFGAVRSRVRLPTNLVVLAAATAILVSYAAVQWVGGTLLEDRYEVVVPLAHTGGLFKNQEVTLLGHGVGKVTELRLTDRGADAVLSIRGDAAVPERAVVQVIRRSTIGEQALNFIPVPAGWERPDGPLIAARVPVADGWQPAARGARIDPVATQFPAEVSEVLNEAVELFSALDPAAVGTVVHELAGAVGGRAELLTELNRDAFDLQSTLVAGIPEFRRLIGSSKTVLDTLDQHRQALAGMFPHLADVSETLAANRPVLEGIIDRGPVALGEGHALITRTRANQHCLIADFAAVGGLIAQPDNLADLSRGLATNHFFFDDGIDLITQHDPFRPGIGWQRINLLMFEEFAGQPHRPHRPTPQTRPGAACRSPFGLGVDAVRQADHQPPDPTAPPIDFAPRVRPTTQAPAGTAGGGSHRTDPAAQSAGAAPSTGPSSPAPGGRSQNLAWMVVPTLLAGSLLAGRRL